MFLSGQPWSPIFINELFFNQNSFVMNPFSFSSCLCEAYKIAALDSAMLVKPRLFVRYGLKNDQKEKF